MDDMYRELILEHSKYPHNSGTLERPDISHEETNPLCGDQIRLDLRVENGIIQDVRFQGRGCAISQAAASLLTDELTGHSLDEARALTKEDMFELIGIPLNNNPARVKCVLLPLKTLKAGIYAYLGAQFKD